MSSCRQVLANAEFPIVMCVLQQVVGNWNTGEVHVSGAAESRGLPWSPGGTKQRFSIRGNAVPRMSEKAAQSFKWLQFLEIPTASAPWWGHLKDE